MENFKEFRRRTLNERSKDGAGITFIDIDETIFNTFAKILVKKDGNTVRELDNQEFNSYKLQDDEVYDFAQFGSADLFHKTSIPIPKTVKLVTKMLKQIKAKKLDSKIIFLTARADFDDKDLFLQTFRDNGIDIDAGSTHVERTGNQKTGTIPERKVKTMLSYLDSGKFTRCRLLDDHKPNIDALADVRDQLSDKTKQKVAKNFGVDADTPIEFFGLLVKPNGTLKRVI